MENLILKKNESKSREFVNPIIPGPEMENLDPSKSIDHTCHNTPGNSTSAKYVIKIPRFDSGTPEEWIIFMDLGQKALVA